MFKRFKILLVLISLSVTLCLMSSTYSRYVATTTGNIDILFAKWQLLVNNTDITNSLGSTLSFRPIIEENENVKSNTFAPSSKGYFDIEIDPTNVDVSFNYAITLKIEQEVMPDLLISKYTIIPNDYDLEEPLTLLNIENNLITNDLLYDNSIENFKFQSFTVRIYFEWYEGENEAMNDESDTTIGTSITETPLNVSADIEFEQIIAQKN